MSLTQPLCDDIRWSDTMMIRKFDDDDMMIWWQDFVSTPNDVSNSTPMWWWDDLVMMRWCDDDDMMWWWWYNDDEMMIWWYYGDEIWWIRESNANLSLHSKLSIEVQWWPRKASLYDMMICWHHDMTTWRYDEENNVKFPHIIVSSQSKSNGCHVEGVGDEINHVPHIAHL